MIHCPLLYAGAFIALLDASAAARLRLVALDLNHPSATFREGNRRKVGIGHVLAYPYNSDNRAVTLYSPSLR